MSFQIYTKLNHDYKPHVPLLQRWIPVDNVSSAEEVDEKLASYSKEGFTKYSDKKRLWQRIVTLEKDSSIEGTHPITFL